MGFAFHEAARSQQIAQRLRYEEEALKNGLEVKRSRRRRRSRKPKVFVPHSHIEPSELFYSLRCGAVETADGKLPLGRVTLTNWDNEILVDSYVKTSSPVVDYRNSKAGFTGGNQRPISIEQVRQKVGQIIQGKILVGHGLELDLSLLGWVHPPEALRDTALCEEYMIPVYDEEESSEILMPRPLSEIAQHFLGRDLEKGLLAECFMSMELYKHAREIWENRIRKERNKKLRQVRLLSEMRYLQLDKLKGGFTQETSDLSSESSFVSSSAPSSKSDPGIYSGKVRGRKGSSETIWESNATLFSFGTPSSKWMPPLIPETSEMGLPIPTPIDSMNEESTMLPSALLEDTLNDEDAILPSTLLEDE